MRHPELEVPASSPTLGAPLARSCIMLEMSDPAQAPLLLLECWIDEARAAAQPHPAAMAFVTVGDDGLPSARTVSLKRLEPEALVFTTALWTRKARELDGNPNVALLFHWPGLGRQVHVTGTAEHAPRALAEELFAERDELHRWQTIISRQGEPITDLQPLRDRLKHLTSVTETPPQCPADWGALRVTPATIEFWAEAPDRLHERRLFTRNSTDGWQATLLAP
jgi:pyridoxamine 5'-phosphate oxidase